MTATPCTCHNGCVPVTGNGGDGYEPCPDCGPEVGDPGLDAFIGPDPIITWPDECGRAEP